MKAWIYQFGPEHHFFRMLASGDTEKPIPAKISGAANRPKLKPAAGDIVFLWLQGDGGGFIGWATISSGDIFEFDHGGGEKDWRVEVKVEAGWVNAPVGREILNEWAMGHFKEAFNLSRSVFYAPKDYIAQALWENVPGGLPRPSMLLGDPSSRARGSHAEKTSRSRKAMSGAKHEKVKAVLKKGEAGASEAGEGDRLESATGEPISEGNKRLPAEQASLTGIDRGTSLNEHEVGLDVDSYAASIATLLRTAKGEMCMALFGHWGLGKTFLAERLQNLLKSPTAYEGRLKNLGLSTEGLEQENGGAYEVAWYSAWRYRRIPEQWIYLYETLVGQFRQAPFWVRWARKLRFNIAKHGLMSLMLMLAALWLVLMPFAEKVEGNQFLSNLFGVAGLTYLVTVFRKGQDTVDKLIAKYAKLPQHRDGLGLQALVGDDLKLLMKSWLPVRADFPMRKMVAGLAVIVLLGGFSLWYFLTQIEVGDPVLLYARMGVLGLWVVLAATVFMLPYLRFDKPEKLLLIVDDLDRCNPEEVVDLIEGTKVLLENEDVKQRLQVLMLIDERVLRHAVHNKFKAMIAASETNSESQIYAEHVEKLFVCWFRLPNLSAAEASSVIEKYSLADARVMYERQEKELAKQEKERAELMRSHANMKTVEVSKKKILDVHDQTEDELKEKLAPVEQRINEIKESLPSVTITTTETAPTPIENGELLYVPEEATLIRQAVAEKLKALGNQERVVTPRMLRMLLFKYQLGRLIYMTLNHKVLADEDQRQMIKLLLDHLFETDGIMTASLRGGGGERKSVECIASQLS